MGEGANLVVTVINNLFHRVRAIGDLAHDIRFGHVDFSPARQHLVQLCQLSNESNQTFFQRMLWLPVSFLLGAAVYFSLRNEPSLSWVGLAILIIVGSIALVRVCPQNFRALPGFLILLFIFAVLGGCYSSFRAHTMPSVPISQSMDRVMVEGWLHSVSGANGRDRLMIKVHAISGLDANNLPKYVRLSQRRVDGVQPGRFVRCFAGLRSPPSAGLPGDYNFSQQAFFSGLGGVGFVYGECEAGRVGRHPSFFERWTYRVNAERRALAKRLVEETDLAAGSGLAAAVLTGDRSFLPEEDQENLQASGLAHLLAISGLHVGLAAGIFYVLMFRLLVLIAPLSVRFPVQKLAQFGALLAITFYLIFSGSSISTQRAYIMLGVGLIYGLFDRPVISFQALALSMFIVILLSPAAVMTPGFQMSFAATAALIAAYRWQFDGTKFRSKTGLFGKVQTFLGGIVLTSLVAGFATMPFAIYHFDRAAPLGFAANLVVMPIVTIISVPLGALTAITIPFGLEEIPLKLFASSLTVVLNLADFFAIQDPPWQSFSFGRLPVLSASLFALAIIIWIIQSRKGRILAAMSLMGGIIVWVVQPSPLIIGDADGHLFVREKTEWREVDLGANGLRPLRFADVESIECRSTCEIKLAGVYRLEAAPGQLEITSMVSSDSYRLERSDYPNGFTAKLKKGEWVVTHLPRNSCRIWSPDWINCRNLLKPI